MIKNKFLRFLATLGTSILSIIIVTLFDKTPGSLITVAALVVMLVWGIFFFWRGVIGYPKSKPLQMIKKLFFLIFLLTALASFAIAIIPFFEDTDGVYPKLAGAPMFAALATYILAVVAGKNKDTKPLDYAIIVPPALTVISILGGFLLSYARPVAWLVPVVFGAAFIGATIYGFNIDHLGFNVSGPSTYSYTPSKSSSSSSSSSSQSTYLTPQDAMRVAAQCCEKTRALSCPAKFFPKITCTFESGCVVFTIGGSVLTNYTGVSRTSIDTALDADLKKLANELETFYQIGIDKLRKQGTSTSAVATAKVMRGDIEIT